MPKGGPKAVKVPVGLNASGTRTLAGSYKVRRIGTSDLVTPWTTVNRKRIKSALIKTVTDGFGWRPPTVYRSAASLRVSNRFLIVNSTPWSLATPQYSGILTIEGDATIGSNGSYGHTPPDSTFFDAFGVPAVSLNLKIQAETEALAKFQSAKLNIGSSLAEAGETIGALAGTVKTIIDIILDVYHGRWTKLAKRFKLHPSYYPSTGANAWLAYKFGLQPLVNDLQGLMEAAQAAILKKNMLLHVRRTVKEQGFPNEEVIPIFLPSYWQWAHATGKIERSACCCIWAKINDSTKATLGKYGLNPPAMLWEALSFSWLIDYMIPIGNFLSALGAPVGLTFLGGTITTRVYVAVQINVMPRDQVGYGSITTYKSNGCLTNYKCLAIYREIFHNWPTPGFYIKDPLQSASHVGTVLALFAGREWRDAKSMGPLVLVGNYAH